MNSLKQKQILADDRAERGEPGLPKLIYIVGRGHSGSTLLELLLNRHREISSMGELSLFNVQLSRDENAPWIGKCSCSLRPSDCPVWSKIAESIGNASGVDVLESPFQWRVTDVGREEDYGWRAASHQVFYLLSRAVRRLYYAVATKPNYVYKLLFESWFENRSYLSQAYAKRVGARVVVDASKDPLDMLDTYFLTGLPVKVIFISRDVKGVAASSVRRKRCAAIEEARSWTAVNKRILRSLAKLERADWIQVKYEDLCNETDEVLATVARFVDVNGSDFTGDNERGRRHTIAGNGLRFKEIGEVRLDDRWREILSDEDLSNIELVAGKVRKQLGYVESCTGSSPCQVTGD